MLGLAERLLPQRVCQALTAVYFRAQNFGRGMHSLESSQSKGGVRVHVLPALKDNYMYLVVDEATREALAVDPVEPSAMEAKVRQEGVRLSTVLTTHHHWDHAGGNSELCTRLPGLQVLGGDDRVQGLTRSVGHEEKLQVGGIQITCLSTPCHTSGHICYLLQGSTSGNPGLVFTGDTLFLGGCGRFFEGTAQQMHRALIQVLGSLPDDTIVYCGHEYAVQNLRFGSQVEPDNPDVKKKLDWAQEQRKKNLPTVPSTLGEEKSYNPFMRVTQASVQAHAKESEPVATMAAIRKEKDNFKG